MLNTPFKASSSPAIERSPLSLGYPTYHIPSCLKKAYKQPGLKGAGGKSK